MCDRETINYYRARAPEYEQIYYRDVPERRRELEEAAERLKQLADGRDVLDLACGTGYWTQVLSTTAASVVAVDISAEMLNEAIKKTYQTPVEFVRADLNALPVPAARYDLITIGFWFSHQPKQEYDQFFKNIVRPLKRAGSIWLIDNNFPAEGPQMESVRVDEHGNNYKRRYLENGEEFIILKNYFSQEELRAIFAHHFSINRLVYGTYYWSVLLSPR
jgi:ubiquinone/menaquinone biosynthesis C-methylase UbiE